MDLLPLPIIFNDVTRQLGRFDVVVLEIFTSLWGKLTPVLPNAMLDLFYDLANRIQETGARVALLKLYRDDLDYRYQAFDFMMESISRRYRIPYLDVGASIIEESGVEFCRATLKDFVHPTPEGSQLIARKVAPFVSEVLSSLPLEMPPARFVRASSKPAPDAVVERGGFNFSYAKICEGESIALSFDSGEIYGIGFVSGPEAGVLEIRAGSMKSTVQCFDPHSYYQRYAFKRLPQTVCDSVTVSQLPGTPTVKLVKGSIASGPRVGGLIDVFLQRRAAPSL